MTQQVEHAVKQTLQPEALQRAQILANFARSQGGGLANFEVTLTTAEAFDLVDWIRDCSGLVSVEGMPQLEADMVTARRANDPWVVLQNFTFYGMKTAPKRILS